MGEAGPKGRKRVLARTIETENGMPHLGIQQTALFGSLFA
jgi:hypothetical protein